MTALLVEAASPGLTLQDEGRFGWRRYGISTAGAMDRLALAVANSLVGNAAGTAALETTLGGCRLRVQDGPVLVGAGGPGVILTIDGRSIPEGQSAEAEPGDLIELSPVRQGVYGYLAIAGGFDLPYQMGSRSTHRRSHLGPLPVATGHMLKVFPKPETAQPLVLLPPPAHTSGPIRIMPGPQDDWFAEDALTRLTDKDWLIGRRSDRMGMFLEGENLSPRQASMVSDGVMPGSIQVPPIGQPIVLMRDCQTAGGYPKIATVIFADLDRLAQMGPGKTVRFEIVSRAEAVAALKRQRDAIEALDPVPAIRSFDTKALLEANLISGVWG